MLLGYSKGAPAEVVVDPENDDDDDGAEDEILQEWKLRRDLQQHDPSLYISEHMFGLCAVQDSTHLISIHVS